MGCSGSKALHIPSKYEKYCEDIEHDLGLSRISIFSYEKYIKRYAIAGLLTRDLLCRAISELFQDSRKVAPVPFIKKKLHETTTLHKLLENKAFKMEKQKFACKENKYDVKKLMVVGILYCKGSNYAKSKFLFEALDSGMQNAVRYSDVDALELINLVLKVPMDMMLKLATEEIEEKKEREEVITEWKEARNNMEKIVLNNYLFPPESSDIIDRYTFIAKVSTGDAHILVNPVNLRTFSQRFRKLDINLSPEPVQIISPMLKEETVPQKETVTETENVFKAPKLTIIDKENQVPAKFGSFNKDVENTNNNEMIPALNQENKIILPTKENTDLESKTKEIVSAAPFQEKEGNQPFMPNHLSIENGCVGHNAKNIDNIAVVKLG